MAKQKAVALVIVEGGIVQEVLSNQKHLDYGAWDWNDFNDDPVAYWEDGDWENETNLTDLFHPQVLQEIRDTVAAMRKLEEEHREQKRRLDPFCDVPEPEGICR